jgi:histidyl-tRNA synthetase
VPQFFRYEKQQRGRLREFYQLNADIVGEASFAADVELVSLAIDVLRGFGFTEKDFVVRICDRSIWVNFFAENGGDLRRSTEFLRVIDKIGREDDTMSEAKLKDSMSYSLRRMKLEEMESCRHHSSDGIVTIAM